jgi:hypothetical protein
MGYYNSFLVKIWIDETDEMRGYIQHVSTQEDMHFLSVDKMVDFMMNHLSPPPNQFPTYKEEDNELMNPSRKLGTTDEQ